MLTKACGRLHDITDARGPDRVVFADKERDIGPNRSGQGKEFPFRKFIGEQVVQATHDGAGIATATTEPSSHRNVFDEPNFNPNCGAVATLAQHRRRPLPGKITGIIWQIRTSQADTGLMRQPQGKDITEVQFLHPGNKVMVAVIATANNTEIQIDLGRCLKSQGRGEIKLHQAARESDRKISFYRLIF